MAVTLSITEAEPANYPQIVIEDDPTVAKNPEPQIRKTVTAAWQRVEGYISYRWNARAVTFVAEGPGDWQSPLLPATITTTEIWRDDQWQAITLRPTPFGGYVLDGCGPYQFTATVGDTNEPPRAVKNAVFRLVEYFTAEEATPLAERFLKSRSYAQRTPDPHGIDENTPDQGVNFERHNPQWIARAMQYSGAADLLRPYRNLGAS